MPRTIDIHSDPRDSVYDALLDYLGRKCQTFSLVWNEDFEFSKSAKEVREKLHPFLVREEVTDEWPGTQLIAHMAIVRHYQVKQESLLILKAQTSSLYSWLRWPPNELPEDLAFYSAKGECVFGSISHEEDSWIAHNFASAAELIREVPGINVAESRS